MQFAPSRFQVGQDARSPIHQNVYQISQSIVYQLLTKFFSFTHSWHPACDISKSSFVQRFARIAELEPLKIMLGWSITFLILAIIAGLLGFVVVAGAAASIAKVLFYVFLILLIVSALARALKGRTP